MDESSLCAPPGKASVLARIAAEGRKFGLGLVVSTQQAGLLPKPVVFNAFTKIVMRLDKTEIRAAARSLEIDDLLLCSLKDPGAALVNFSDFHQWHRIQVKRIAPCPPWPSIAWARL